MRRQPTQKRRIYEKQIFFYITSIFWIVIITGDRFRQYVAKRC